MPSYRVSKKAQSDIRDIGLYTQQQWGKEQRRAYLSGMQTRFERLYRPGWRYPDRPGFT